MQAAETTHLVRDLAVVLGVAGVTGVISRRLRQPSILGYLLAGLLIGPHLGLPLFVDAARVTSLSELGVVLVMFAVGLELRVGALVRVLPTAGLTAMVQIGAMLWAGHTLGLAFGWSATEALFLGASIAISSTMVVSRVLADRPIHKDSNSLVFGVLVLQDVAAIALIAVMTAVGKGATVAPAELVAVVGRLGAVLALMVLAGMLLVPRAARAVVGMGSAETVVVASAGLCLSAAVLADALGYSVALGAFVAGTVVAESGKGPEVEHAISAVRDLFAAVFFVSVGMTVDPSLVLTHLPLSLAVLAVVVLGQFLSVTGGAVLAGNGLRRSVVAATALGQIGEFAFILAGIGVVHGVVGPALQPVLVTVAVLSTFTTARMLAASDRIAHRVDAVLPARLHRLLAFIAVWHERLRDLPDATRTPMLRALRAIALDALGVVAVVASWRMFGDVLSGWIGPRLPSAWPPIATGPVLVLVLSVPFLISAVATTRRLSRLVTDRLLGDEVPAGRPLHDLLADLVAMVVLAGVGLPLAAVVRPLVGVPVVLPVVTLALLTGTWLVWRATARSEGDLKSNTERLLAAVVRQGAEEAPDLALFAQLAPGIAHLDCLTLPADAPACGQTLGDLDLRARSGASILAVLRAGEVLSTPGGGLRLLADDILALAGTADAEQRARALLLTGALPAPEPRDHG